MVWPLPSCHSTLPYLQFYTRPTVNRLSDTPPILQTYKGLMTNKSLPSFSSSSPNHFPPKLLPLFSTQHWHLISLDASFLSCQSHDHPPSINSAYWDRKQFLKVSTLYWYAKQRLYTQKHNRKILLLSRKVANLLMVKTIKQNVTFAFWDSYKTANLIYSVQY